jgi:hypothetical protein
MNERTSSQRTGRVEGDEQIADCTCSGNGEQSKAEHARSVELECLALH